MQSEGARRMSNNIQNIDKGYLNCCYMQVLQKQFYYTYTYLLYIPMGLDTVHTMTLK